MQSEPARIPLTRARQWQLRLESGSVSGPLRLELGWRPEQLVFLAQGPAPFEAVAGRALDRLEQFPQDRVMGDRSIFKMLRESAQAGSATLGPRENRAGPAALDIAATQTWRIMLLWAGLIGAVALVAWLVFSLMRDLRRQGPAQ